MEFDAPRILKLLEAIKGQYLLDWQGIHGILYWARVWEWVQAPLPGAQLRTRPLYFKGSRRAIKSSINGGGFLPRRAAAT